MDTLAVGGHWHYVLPSFQTALLPHTVGAKVPKKTVRSGSNWNAWKRRQSEGNGHTEPVRLNTVMDRGKPELGGRVMENK